MKCKYCGYEAPVIARYGYEEEFIDTVTVKDGNGEHLEPILRCPKCKGVQ